MSEPKVPEFNRRKFKDVVHFICANCSIEELGNVKLHKALYFSDMLHFLANGTPLTGVEYRKQKFGPVARHLTSVVNELCREGRLRVSKRDYFGFPKIDYLSVAPPPTNLLTNEEIHLLKDVIDYVCAKSAREISEISHDAAWKAARMGETIPYYAAWGLVPVAITESDIEAAVGEARRIRPLIDGDRASC
ncbi:MAG: Panacea domain-containing protein [Hyphomicrobium sp.]|jgi:uncharacterized phage-associated protein